MTHAPTDFAANGGTGADLPLYRRLVESLRGEIEAGVHPVGRQLPTEGEMQTRFGVSRHTVREALRQLKEEGFVTSRQGAGTTVVSRVRPKRFLHEVASINDLITHAHELKYEVESSGMVAAGFELAERLGCAQGDRWLRVEGFRHPEGDPTPAAWAEVFIRADFAGVALNLGRRPGPIYLWIEEMYGTSVEEVEQVIRARPIPEAAAGSLGLKTGEPGVEVRRAYQLAGGACALVAFTIYPAERFSHTTTLRRAKSAG
jgi:DNA-binding GntR family transcriptional regulator